MKGRSSILMVAAWTLFVVDPAPACTYFAVSTKTGQHILGRSVEFGLQEDGSSVAANFRSVPRGKHHTSRTDKGFEPLKWVNKFGYSGPSHAEDTLFSEGVNEKGLTVAMLWFIDGEYPKPVVGAPNLSNADVVEWMLGQFDSAKSAVEGLREVNVSQHMTKFGYALPLHWSVADRSGASYVVEYLDGKLSVTDNSDLRVMCNSPRIEWHRRNLAQFKNDFPHLDAANEENNQGFLDGLPGSWSSPSRFLRIAVQRDLLGDVKDIPTAVNIAVHLLNTVDYVTGVPQMKGRGSSAGAQETSFITVIDPYNLHYFIRTQDSLNVHRIDLSKIDYSEGAEVTSFNIYGGSPFIDVTEMATTKSSDGE